MPEPVDTELRRRLQQALGEGYELRGLLGEGGFAVVYTALDRRLNREVAVKVLRLELYEAPAARERFRREAEAAARLRHPHIIPIYAVGDTEGLAYFVMPRIVGESLAARLDREKRLPVAEARRILGEAADALATAHRAGVVHRDVKPDNILLEGPDARVVVTDFGIAKAAESKGERLTQTGVVVGTPLYMSPEQASGERAIDHRSDLYSLGVVAYHMLTGEPPFGGASAAAVLVKHLTEEPPPVTRRRPDCPQEVAAAVARCLAKDPGQRWRSAEDLCHALSPAALEPTREERRGVAADGAGIPEPLRRFRRLAGLAALGVVVLAVVDLALQRVLFAPLGLLIAAFVVGAHYGPLWTAGYDWRDVLRRRLPPGAEPRTPVSLDAPEFGPHASAVEQARADRTAILALIQRLPRAEQLRLGDLLPVLDEAVGRAAGDARQLHALERQIAPGLEELDGRVAATRAEPASPGRDQRLAVLERRREVVTGLLERRERLSQHLGAALQAMSRVRFELERVGAVGVTEALDGIRAAVRRAAQT